MDKSPEAFRTISEVAEALETPAHVLRFWESRFPQIRPVKRAGGRRYYRPADVALLTGIKRLLHDEGMTIRGVQKILREQGIRHVSGLTDEPSPEEEALEAAMLGRLDAEDAPPPDEAEEATAAALEAALDEAAEPEDLPEPAPPLAPPETVAPPAVSALDWLAHLPEARAPQAARPPDPPAEPPATVAAAETTPELPFPGPPPPPPPPTAARPESPADEATATLAARLRALPMRSLASRHDDLAEIAGRIARLRARLAAPPTGP
jgi:DNA-binding transcriptional MerR regulator